MAVRKFIDNDSNSDKIDPTPSDWSEEKNTAHEPKISEPPISFSDTVPPETNVKRKFKRIFILISFVMLVGSLAIWYSYESASSKPNHSPIEGVDESSATSQIEFLEIIADDVNLRNGPGRRYKIMATVDTGLRAKILQVGQSETVQSKTDFWYQIEYKGAKLWVFGYYTSRRR